jgi:hypothetical protein
LQAAEQSARRNRLITTTGVGVNITNGGYVTFNDTNIIVVLWTENPEEEAGVFWTIGMFILCFSSLIC